MLLVIQSQTDNETFVFILDGKAGTCSVRSRFFVFYVTAEEFSPACMEDEFGFLMSRKYSVS